MAGNRQWRNSLLLTLTAVIWGVAFVAQSEGSNYMGSCTFTGLRFLIAAAALWPVIIFRKRERNKRHQALAEAVAEPCAIAGRSGGVRGGAPSRWKAGALCGVLLCLASLVQQEGIALGTGAGKAGFITAFYIVLVPILNFIVFRKRTGVSLWISVAIAIVGLYLLCINETLTLQTSDLLVLLCAFAFSFQILCVDRYAPQYDALELAAIQFLTCGVLSSILMVFRDMAPDGLAAWAAPFATWNAWIPLLYAAILSSAVGYTLQIVGQKGLNPALASLLMSLESVFAVLAGWLILHQIMTSRELVGSLLVFVAVIIAQVAPAKTH